MDTKMTNDITTKLETLRGLAERTNRASDQASALVEKIETFLTDTIKIGVAAQVGPIDSRDEEPAANGLPRARTYYLEYNRISGDKFRIFVSTTLGEDGHDEYTEGWKVVEQSQIRWASCSKQLKLKACAQLPELLSAVIENAEQLAIDAEAAHAASADLAAMVEPES